MKPLPRSYDLSDFTASCIYMIFNISGVRIDPSYIKLSLLIRTSICNYILLKGHNRLGLDQANTMYFLNYAYVSNIIFLHITYLSVVCFNIGFSHRLTPHGRRYFALIFD